MTMWQKSGRFLPLDIQLDNTSEETFEGTLCVTSQEPDYDGYSNNSQEKYDTYRYEFPVMIQGDSSLEKKLNISLQQVRPDVHHTYGWGRQ